MSKGIELGKPVIVTFRDLRAALFALHQNIKADVDSLHDVWLTGAPTPDSIILNPKGYDPRMAQAGNIEKRIISPVTLAKWIQDTSARRGMPLDWRQCLNIAEGRADYGVDMHTKPLIVMTKGW